MNLLASLRLEVARLQSQSQSDFDRWYRNRYAHEVRLGLPIPYTGNITGNKWRSRHPRTTQERRMIAGAIADGEPYRAGRRWIPSAYDDVMKRSSRSWKRHRRTQWKD